MKRFLQSYGIPVGLLLLMLLQMSAASPTQSAAFDEGYTITYGYAYLHTGDARLSRGQNPPLTNVFIALPLLLRSDIAFPANHPAWVDGDIFGFTNEFLWQANKDPQQLVLLARLPEMMLALLLASVIYAFTRFFFDQRAAWWAMILCAFDPNVLAHGQIVGTDLGVAFFMFSATGLWVAALKRMSAKRALASGLFLGAALATKYSAVWLLPPLILIGLTYPSAHPARLSRLKLWLISALAALGVLWVTFGFSIGPVSPGGVPLPAPQYWQSVSKVSDRVGTGTAAFLMGQVSPQGFWQYYPFVFALKTPLPTLIFLLLGIFSLFARRRRADLAVWTVPTFFLLIAMWAGLDLGYRLILPVLPFVLMLAGQGVEVLRCGTFTPQDRDRLNLSAHAVTRWRRAGIVLLLSWLAIDTMLIAPSYLAYFNQLAGDRAHDYELLVDSNLDWGQDLIALRDWLKSHQIDQVRLAYFGTAHPEAYGVPAQLLASFPLNDHGREIDGFNAYALRPGWYAISATSLQLGVLYTHWNMYAPFRLRSPDARIGRSLLLYHVTYSSPDIDRTVVLGLPATDLSEALVGRQPDRQLVVKWAGPDTTVLALQGPARYVASNEEALAAFAPEVHQALLAHARRLNHAQDENLQLFEIDAATALQDKLTALQSGKIFAPDETPLQLPIPFTGGLSLVGYDLLERPNAPRELVTYWHVDQTQSKRLKVFVEALDESGRIIAQGNGLNASWTSLEPGDLVIQRIIIEPAAAIQTLNVGLYDPGNGQHESTTAQLEHVTLNLSR